MVIVSIMSSLVSHHFSTAVSIRRLVLSLPCVGCADPVHGAGHSGIMALSMLFLLLSCKLWAYARLLF